MKMNIKTLSLWSFVCVKFPSNGKDWLQITFMNKIWYVYKYLRPTFCLLDLAAFVSRSVSSSEATLS